MMNFYNFYVFILFFTEVNQINHHLIKLSSYYNLIFLRGNFFRIYGE